MSKHGLQFAPFEIRYKDLTVKYKSPLYIYYDLSAKKIIIEYNGERNARNILKKMAYTDHISNYKIFLDLNWNDIIGSKINDKFGLSLFNAIVNSNSSFDEYKVIDDSTHKELLSLKNFSYGFTYDLPSDNNKFIKIKTFIPSEIGSDMPDGLKHFEYLGDGKLQFGINYDNLDNKSVENINALLSFIFNFENSAFLINNSSKIKLGIGLKKQELSFASNEDALLILKNGFFDKMRILYSDGLIPNINNFPPYNRRDVYDIVKIMHYVDSHRNSLLLDELEEKKIASKSQINFTLDREYISGNDTFYQWSITHL